MHEQWRLLGLPFKLSHYLLAFWHILASCQYMKVICLPVVVVIHFMMYSCNVDQYTSSVYTLVSHHKYPLSRSPCAFLLYAWQKFFLFVPAKAMKSLEIPKGVKRVLFRTLNTDRYLYINICNWFWICFRSIHGSQTCTWSNCICFFDYIVL